MATTTIGVKLFGAINRVPDVGVIETRFFFIAGIPLVPLGSVVRRFGEPDRPIGLSLRSMARAYLSGLAALLALVMTVLTVAVLYKALFGHFYRKPGAGWWATMIGGWVVLVAAIALGKLLAARTTRGDALVRNETTRSDLSSAR